MIFALRFTVLQVILLSAIACAWLLGYAQMPFAGNSAYLCMLVLAVFAAGMLAVAFKNFRYAQWIATHVLRLGLLGTVVGLIIAFSAAGKGISSDPDAMRALVGSVIDGMYIALWVTFFGIAANLWLKLHCLLLGGVDD
jgi:hypothetical protein